MLCVVLGGEQELNVILWTRLYALNTEEGLMLMEVTSEFTISLDSAGPQAGTPPGRCHQICFGMRVLLCTVSGVLLAKHI
jgi:hypothetical protein